MLQHRSPHFKRFQIPAPKSSRVSRSWQDIADQMPEMLCLSIHPYFICIAFLFSFAEGFVTTPQPRTLIASTSSGCFSVITHRDSRSYPQSWTNRRHGSLRAVKREPKTASTATDSGSDKIKEMASFLSIQLLEKVMAQMMKPEGESTIDAGTIERITKALQMTGQPSSEGEATASAVIEDSSEGDDASLNSEETTEPTLSMPSEIKSLDAPASAIEDDSEGSNDLAGAQMSETLAVEASEDPDVADARMQKEIEEIVARAKAKEEAAVPVSERAMSAPQTPKTLRKPLEIIQSNIPPLRPESVPRKSSSVAEDQKQEAETHLSSTSEMEFSEASDTPVKPEGSESEVDDPLPSLGDEETEQDLIDPISSAGVDEEAQSSEMKASKPDIGSPASESSGSIPPIEETHKGESTTISNDSEPGEFERKSPDLTTQKTPLTISKRRVETIVARRQPKSSDEEHKLAERYAAMDNIEDRAFALLSDLGMIEEHLNPSNPLYDHSKDDEYCEQRFLPYLGKDRKKKS